MTRLVAASLVFLLLLVLAATATAGEHPEKSVCTVCAMRATHGEPEPEHVAGHSEYEGKTYYFCSKSCKEQFDESPAWWLPMQLPHAFPSIDVRGLKGNPGSPELVEGQVTLIDFWATWCKPCVKLMRHLQQRSERAPSDLRILGVSIDDDDRAIDKVRSFVKKHGIRYPIYLEDGEASAWTALRVHSVPTTLLVDRDGQIVKRWVGRVDHDELDAASDELFAGGDGQH